MTTIYLVAGLVLLVILSFIGIMTRYKKCGPNKILVVYGKTSGNKSCKCYRGSGVFVLPVIQDYQFMSMEPISLTCERKDALDKNNIRVNVRSESTVAISPEEELMQNAATRLLGLKSDEITDLLKGIIYGQLRLIISQLDVISLVNSRNEFLRECETNLTEELKKLGYSLLNINLSGVDDEADIIINRGKRSEEEAKYSVLIAIQVQ